MRLTPTILTLILGLTLPVASAQDEGAERRHAEEQMVQRLEALDAALSTSPSAEWTAQAEADGPTSSIAGGAFLGVQLAIDEGPGILVAGALPGHAAAKAGIVAGDRLLSIGGDELADYAELQRTMASLSPGDQVDIVVARGDQRVEMAVTLGAREPEARPQAAERELHQRLTEMQAWHDNFGERLDAMRRELEAHTQQSQALMQRFDPSTASPQLKRLLDAEWRRRDRAKQEVQRLREMLDGARQGQPRARRALPESLRGLRFHPREEAEQGKTDEDSQSEQGERRARRQELRQEVEDLRASIEALRRKLAETEGQDR